MAKILYPVGTEVARKSVDVPARLRVAKYHKGTDEPYELEYVKSTLNRENFRAHVSDLCRFENHRYNSKKVETTPQETAQTPVKSLTAAQVAEIVRSELQEQRARDEEREFEIELYEIINADEKAEKEKKKMNSGKTLRQMVRWASLSKDERILRESGFLDEAGNVTEQGRRIIIDTIYANDAELRKEIVKMVKKTLPKASKNDESDE